VEKRNPFNNWVELPPKRITEYRAYSEDEDIPLKSTVSKIFSDEELKENTNDTSFNTFKFEQRNGSICALIITETGERIVSPTISGNNTGIKLIVHEIEEFSNKINIYPSGQTEKLDELIIGIEKNAIRYIKKMSTTQFSDSITTTYHFENDKPSKYSKNNNLTGHDIVKLSLIDGKYVLKSDEKMIDADRFVGEHVARYFNAFSEKHAYIKESLNNCLKFLKIEGISSKLKKFGGIDTNKKNYAEIKKFKQNSTNKLGEI